MPACDNCGHPKLIKIEAIFDHVGQVINCCKLHHWIDQLKYSKCTKIGFGDLHSSWTVSSSVAAVFYAFATLYTDILS